MTLDELADFLAKRGLSLRFAELALEGDGIRRFRCDVVNPDGAIVHSPLSAPIIEQEAPLAEDSLSAYLAAKALRA